jgi:Flp pilus assembly protein TadG
VARIEASGRAEGTRSSVSSTGRARLDGERGAAFVEFALVMPLVMVLLLGLVSAGMAWNQKLSLTHAAREGARYGATIPRDQSFTSGTWASNVRSLIVDRSGGELSGSEASVCV